MNQLPTNSGSTDNPRAILRYIDQLTAETVQMATGHAPHEQDMVVTHSDGRYFAIVNHRGKAYVHEYRHSIEEAYRSFLARPEIVRASPIPEIIERALHESGYGHGV